MASKATVQSVEPNVADLVNGWLKSYKVDYKLEQESLNTEIDQALNDYFPRMAAKVVIDLMQNYCYLLMMENTIQF